MRKSWIADGVGDSDVGDFMMVTDFRCWWQNHYIGDFFVKLVILSMYSKIRHQHRCNRQGQVVRRSFLIKYPKVTPWLDFLSMTMIISEKFNHFMLKTVDPFKVEWGQKVNSTLNNAIHDSSIRARI